MSSDRCCVGSKKKWYRHSGWTKGEHTCAQTNYILTVSTVKIFRNIVLTQDTNVMYSIRKEEQFKGNLIVIIWIIVRVFILLVPGSLSFCIIGVMISSRFCLCDMKSCVVASEVFSTHSVFSLHELVMMFFT